MQCASCGSDNPEGTKFCGACGVPFQVRCPQCGFANLPSTKFCRECGTPLTGQSSVPKLSSQTPSREPPLHYTPKHLAERILAEQAAMEARGAADGERKTITALFANLKGSTALIEGLDPEEARAIIDPAPQLMMDAVHRYEGYVAQALGDGILALFGAPIAHEDHPQRALFAALRMQEGMRRYSDEVRLKGGAPLLMRVGINTGEVIVRSIRKDDLHTDYVPVGHSTNLAARMEQMAVPGSILITDYTQKLTEGFFDLKGLGAAEIKGMAGPLPVYEVVGAGPLRTRLQVAARRGLTRFVGRHAELQQLQRALEQAQAGHGQIVGVMGEPGLGKSRLFYEFQLLAQSGGLVLEAYAVSYGKASPYLPLIELLKGYFQMQLQDDARTRRERVIGKVLGLDRSLEDTLPYLFSLLGIDDPTSALQQMDPQIRRRRTFEALKKLFLRESLNHPLLLIFEDLHWIDGETQGFLDTLSEGVATARLLLLVNYRPEYRHEWGTKTYYTQLRLAPFGQEEAEEFLTVVLGSDARLHALKQVILQKTEGTPFFMEEVVQDLVEQGALVRAPGGGAGFTPAPTGPATSAFHIPTTVQGVLAARIDRLSAEEKELLQQLAVIGREFSLSLVIRVLAQREEAWYPRLASLQKKEFLYEQPAFPEVEYIFKHALTQEVAYHSVLHERRKALHERTAQAIEALYPSRLEEHYSELAHHYSRSDNTRKAVEYLSLAGQQAVQRSAYTEAITHLLTAFGLLKTLPDTPERTQQELDLQLTLGPALIATKGFVPEVGEAYTRARELCRQVGETSQLFSTLFGLWLFFVVREELQPLRELGEQLLSLAQSLQDPTRLLTAHIALGYELYFLGEFVPAQEHAEQSMALYDLEQYRALTLFYGGVDPGVDSLSLAAWSLWMLGYPDQALKKSHEALTLGQELSHPHSLAFALCFATELRQFRQEDQAIQEQAAALITLATEQGFPFWLARGTIVQGWVRSEQGQEEEGIAQIRQGLDAYRATGAEIWRSYHLALLAEAYGKVGQAAEGRTVVIAALDRAHSNGDRYYEAELYRLKGTLTLQSKTRLGQVSSKSQASQDRSEDTTSQPLTANPQAEAEAEACFHQAIDIARRQSAKSLELRAVMNLARLWQSQGKKQEAHTLLAEIYGWFTEGFDTKDLQEAKVLLEELTPSGPVVSAARNKNEVL